MVPRFRESILAVETEILAKSSQTKAAQESEELCLFSRKYTGGEVSVATITDDRNDDCVLNLF